MVKVFGINSSINKAIGKNNNKKIDKSIAKYSFKKESSMEILSKTFLCPNKEKSKIHSRKVIFPKAKQGQSIKTISHIPQIKIYNSHK